MKKLFESLLIAFCVALIISVIIHLPIYFDGIAKNDKPYYFIASYFISFFFPIFFSLYFLKKDSYKVKILSLVKIVFYCLIFLSFFEIIGTYSSGHYYKGKYYYQPRFTFRMITHVAIERQGIIILITILFILLFKSKIASLKNDFYSLIYAWCLPSLFFVLLSLTINSITFKIEENIIVFVGVFYCGAFLYLKTRGILTTNSYLIYIVLSIILLPLFTEFICFVFGYEFSVLRFLSQLIYLTVITVFFYFLIIYKEKKIEKERLKKEAEALELDYQELKQQLSPSFLFSNIDFLTNLIEENPIKAIRFSENLSNIYRDVLEQEKQDIVTLKEEIQFIKNYINLLKIKTESNIVVIVTIEDIFLKKYIISGSFYQVLKKIEKTLNKKEESSILLSISNNKIKAVFNKILEIDKEINIIKKRYSFFTDELITVKNEKENTVVELPLLSE